jgi:hypothetical protein
MALSKERSIRSPLDQRHVDCGLCMIDVGRPDVGRLVFAKRWNVRVTHWMLQAIGERRFSVLRRRRTFPNARPDIAGLQPSAFLWESTTDWINFELTESTFLDSF